MTVRPERIPGSSQLEDAKGVLGKSIFPRGWGANVMSSLWGDVFGKHTNQPKTNCATRKEKRKNVYPPLGGFFSFLFAVFVAL